MVLDFSNDSVFVGRDTSSVDGFAVTQCGNASVEFGSSRNRFHRFHVLGQRGVAGHAHAKSLTYMQHVLGVKNMQRHVIATTIF